TDGRSRTTSSLVSLAIAYLLLVVIGVGAIAILPPGTASSGLAALNPFGPAGQRIAGLEPHAARPGFSLRRTGVRHGDGTACRRGVDVPARDRPPAQLGHPARFRPRGDRRALVVRPTHRTN